MNKRAYIIPVCTCIQVNCSALLGTSVLPVGTQAGNGTDISREDWDDKGKVIGGIGVGGDEFEGDNW